METIAALSTAPARSGVGVIRISGDDAFSVADKLFITAAGKRPAYRYMTYGSIVSRDGRLIDKAMAVYFKGPNSFTGEDVVELHCHGSLAVINMSLTEIFALGVRQALPGEFTKRAFLEGKLDLTQAEAIGELIAAESEQLAYNAAAQLEGSLSVKIEDMYNRLILVLAHFQAVVDYPDEDIDELKKEDIISRISCEVKELDSMISQGERGSLYREGIKCAIVGSPNVGKSSLLNALAGYNRAIVTPVAGTTRDIVEAEVMVGGITLKLQDTAGLRETEDTVEKIGVELAKKALEESALILYVIDGGEPYTGKILHNAGMNGKPVIAIVNKNDLEISADIERIKRDFERVIELSAKNRTGLDLLEAEIKRIFDTGELSFDGTLITSARQLGACAAARDGLQAALEALSIGSLPDMIMYDIEQACAMLAGITGRNTTEDIVDSIFANFCVGK